MSAKEKIIELLEQIDDEELINTIYKLLCRIYVLRKSNKI